MLRKGRDENRESGSNGNALFDMSNSLKLSIRSSVRERRQAQPLDTCSHIRFTHAKSGDFESNKDRAVARF